MRLGALRFTQYDKSRNKRSTTCLFKGKVKRLSLLLCADQLSASTQTLIVNALNATPVTAASTDTVKRNRVAAAVLMVMASAEYLVQK